MRLSSLLKLLITYLCAILSKVTSLTLTQLVKLISRSLAPEGPSTT